MKTDLNDDDEEKRIGEILYTDCSCHISAPCNRCMLLTEDEVDYASTHPLDEMEDYLIEKVEKIDGIMRGKTT